ncbi:MAG: ComF family protein [Bacteroides sp.]
MMKIDWFIHFLHLLFPQSCVVCGGRLLSQDKYVCFHCKAEMPLVRDRLLKGNEVEQRFWGQLPIERASSLFYYIHENNYRRIVIQLKYNGQEEIGEVMGKYMADGLLQTDFFEGIEVIIPVPLHPKKRRLRGYNQSECIALGVSQTTNIPLDTVTVERKVANVTQTHKNHQERWDNVENIFAVIYPERIQGKHILLIDDVLTTGATLLSCAGEISKVSGVKISILTLAFVP